MKFSYPLTPHKAQNFKFLSRASFAEEDEEGGMVAKVNKTKLG